MASKSTSSMRTSARANGRSGWPAPRNTQAVERSGETRAAYTQGNQPQGGYSNYLPDYEAEAERRGTYSLSAQGASPSTSLGTVQATLSSALPGMEASFTGGAL